MYDINKENIESLNKIPLNNNISNDYIEEKKLSLDELIKLLKSKNESDEEYNEKYKNKKNKEKEIQNKKNSIEQRNNDIDICKSIIKKIHNSKNRYDKKNLISNEKNNDEIKESNDKKNIISSFIYFCKDSDVKKLLSGKKRIYDCNSYDIRLDGLNYLYVKIIFNEIISYETKNNKEEYFIDNGVKKYYDESKEYKNNKDKYFIYHRKKIFDENLRSLLKNRKFPFGKNNE